jgi:hypothetical protein
MYEYWLGGRENYAADRAAAEAVMAGFPGIVRAAREQRGFLKRAVRYLAGPAGITQFLDIGTGIPTAENTHEVAQAIDPECRVVYVDNDPMVLAHASALLRDTAGHTAYLDADLRDTDKILGEAAGMLDFQQPVAILLVGILQLIPDKDDPRAITRRLLNAVPTGSWLAIAHPADVGPPGMRQAANRYNETAVTPVTLRTRAEIEPFFDGTTLLAPGLVEYDLWRPESTPDPDGVVPCYCALGQKP